jgi:hypothetical protein
VAITASTEARPVDDMVLISDCSFLMGSDDPRRVGSKQGQR